MKTHQDARKGTKPTIIQFQLARQVSIVWWNEDYPLSPTSWERCPIKEQRATVFANSVEEAIDLGFTLADCWYPEGEKLCTLSEGKSLEYGAIRVKSQKVIEKRQYGPRLQPGTTAFFKRALIQAGLYTEPATEKFKLDATDSHATVKVLSSATGPVSSLDPHSAPGPDFDSRMRWRLELRSDSKDPPAWMVIDSMINRVIDPDHPSDLDEGKFFFL